MKLKLSKQWYEERAKAEAKCENFAASASKHLIVAEDNAGAIYRTKRSSRKSVSKKNSRSSKNEE